MGEITRLLSAFPNQYLSTSAVRDQTAINYWTANLKSPFYPLLAGTNKAGTTLQRQTLVRAYPQFDGVNTNTYEGNSWYNALEAKLEKRFSGGYTFQATYTWSKFLEASSFLNEGDARPERVISDQDCPHRMSISGIYELPFGRGKKLLAGIGPVATKFVGGWQLQGMYLFQSGTALGWGNVIFTGDVYNITLSGRDPDRWFNTDAGFNRNSAQQLSYNLRTFPSRLSSVRADGMNNFDLSIIKDTQIKESMHAQFRAEFLNAMNHPMFNSPDGTPTSTSFGIVTSQKNFARRIQMGIKFIF